MAAQEIAVTCKNCGNKTRCSVTEWSAGFACSHCGILVQRPNPKQKQGGKDALATGKFQLDNMLRPTVSAVSLTPSQTIPNRASESASLKIVRPAVSAKPVSPVPTKSGPVEGVIVPTSPTETGSFDIQASASLQRLQAENRSLRDNVKSITIAHAKAEAELDVLREQHEEISGKVSGLQTELSTLKRARAKLQEQVREMSEESANTDVQGREDLAGARAARDEAESNLARLQIEHKIMKEKLDQFIKEKVELGRQVAKLDEERTSLQAEKETLKAEAAAIGHDKAELEKTKAELEKEQEKLQAEAVDLARKVIPQDKLDEFKKRFASEVAQKKIMANKLEQAGAELKRLSMEVAKKDAMVKAIAIAKATADKKLEAAGSTSQDAEMAVVEVKILREKLDGLITELHNAEDAGKADAAALKKEEAARAAAQKQLDELRAELDAATAKADGLSNDRSAAEAALKAEVEALKKQVADAETAPAAVPVSDDARVAALMEEITGLNQQLADLEDADSEELKALKEANQELTARLAATEDAAASSTTGPSAEQTLELKKTLAKTIAENRVIREKMTAMVSDVKRSRTHIEVLNRKNAEIQEALAASRGNDTEDATTIGEMQARITTLEAEREAAIAAAVSTAGSSDETKALKATIAELQAKLAAKPTAPATGTATVTDETKALKATIAELQTKLAAKPTAPAAGGTADKELAELRAANTALTAELKTLKANPPAPAAGGDGSEALMRAQLESQILREKLEQLVEELDEAHKATEAAKADGAKAAAAAHKSDKPAAKSAPADDGKAKELAAANAKLTAELEGLKAEVAKLKAAPAATSAKAEAATTSAPAVDAGELAAELERVKSELATAKELLADSDDSGKKKKGAQPDKLKILELTEQTKALTTDVERLRKKVKEDRREALKGIVVPSIAEDIEALALKNRALEHKLQALEQERHQLLTELEDWRDDGILNNSTDGMSLKSVVLPFPDEAITIVRSVVGDAPVVFALTTQHKVDTGLWARKSACHLAITPDAVVVAAPGKQDVVQKIPRELTVDSFWNPVTNQLVFSPGIADAPIPGLTMDRESADAAMAVMRAGTITVEAVAAAPAPATASVAG